MNIEIKKLPKSEVEIKITVPWEKWKAFLDEASGEISKDIKIKGFRPGKAPKNMVEQKIGKGSVLDLAARKVIEKTYQEAIVKEKIDAIGSPQVEISKLAEGNDLEYRARTAITPEAKLKSWRKDIEKINKNYKDKKIEVSDDEVNKELEGIAKSRVKLVMVNREAQKGDSVEIDFQVSRNNVPIENGTSKKHPLILGSNVFVPGFEDNIIGMKEKEEKEFELKFPEAYHDKNLAGNSATFKVKMNLVQERQVPKINDEFAKSLGKFENLENLKKNIKEGLLKEKEEKQKEQKRTDLAEKLTELVETDIPAVMLHVELHKMIEEFKMRVEGMGMEFGTYLSQIKKTEDDLEKEWEPQAEKRIKSVMALEKIAQELDIKADTAKIEEEMNKTLQYYKNVKNLEKNIDMARLYDYVKGMLTNEEVFKYLEGLY